MMWWVLIFAFGAGAVLWAGLSIYIRLRRNFKQSTEKEALPGGSEPL
jgi:hypothetical protein